MNLPDHQFSGCNSRICHPYATLGLIYDRVMNHVDYRQWALYLKKIFRKTGIPNGRLLDIGCGTGRLIQELKQLNFEIEGCEPSTTMLAVARKRNPDTKYWQDSLPQLTNLIGEKYAAVTCLYDTINYLPDLNTISMALRKIYNLLLPGGICVFDTVSEPFCQTYFNLTSEKEVLDDEYAYERNSYYDKINREQINQFKIYTPQGIFEEEHTQFIFSFIELRNLVEYRTDFELLGVYEDFTFFEADEGSNRAHFVLRKGGDE